MSSPAHVQNLSYLFERFFRQSLKKALRVTDIALMTTESAFNEAKAKASLLSSTVKPGPLNLHLGPWRRFPSLP
jgi:hypothetical protein